MSGWRIAELGLDGLCGWFARARSTGEEADTVRRLYREVLRWGTARGHPRRPAQTPLEYGALLGELYPEGRAHVTLLTQAYVQARYGSGTPRSPEDRRVGTACDSEAKMECLREAWWTLRAMKLVVRKEADERSGT